MTFKGLQLHADGLTVTYEIWLKSNRRAGVLLSIPFLLGTAVSGGVAIAIWPSAWAWLAIAGALVMLAGVIALLLFLRLPRVAYQDHELRVYLQGLHPLAVPIDIVECFFLGQGPSMLPRSLEGKEGEATETATVVIRLAESAKEWHHRDVQAFLGQWCEGYITIRGTWSERLTKEVVGNLNHRLVEAHRRLKQVRQQSVPA